MKYLLSLLAIFCVIFLPQPALASRDVTSPYVEKGELEVKWKGGITHDDEDEELDGAWKQKLGVGYGFTDWLNLKVEGSLEQAGDSDDTEFSSVAAESKFQFTEKGDAWVDVGARLKYQYSTNAGTDKLEAKLLLGKNIGQFTHRANVTLDRQVGEGAGNDTNAGVSWSSRYKYNGLFDPGFEYYAEFGPLTDSGSFEEQGHLLGPVAYGKFENGLKYEAGYLFGVSDSSADGEAKLILSYAVDF